MDRQKADSSENTAVTFISDSVDRNSNLLKLQAQKYTKFMRVLDL
jgi:hypothetical protein